MSPNSENPAALVIWKIRIPRIVAAILVGASLSIAGCLLQTVTKNDLSSPYTLGVSQGAGLVVLIIFGFFPRLSAMTPILAMTGGLSAFLITWIIAQKGRNDIDKTGTVWNNLRLSYGFGS